jgi:hypothetical protein
MGTTLTGTTPQDTYDSLIKVTDNGPLSGSLKKLTDGLGNDSALSLSTGAISVSGNIYSTASSGVIFDNVSGDTSAMQFRLQNTGANVRVGAESSAGDSAQIGTSAYAAFFGNQANAPTEFTTNGTMRMHISSAGNVGIGTSSPAAKLDVVSTSNVRATDNSDKPYINFSNADASFSWGRVGGLLTGAGDGSLYFQTKTGSALTEKMQLTDTGYLRLLSGTNGIQFNGATAAANALDDYEEGTWTPVITDGTNDATMIAGNGGEYTKIGRQVTAHAYCRTSSLGSVSGIVFVKGLPFASLNSLQSIGSVTFGYYTGMNLASGQSVGGFIGSNATRITLTLNDTAGGTSELQASEWSATGYVHLTITYFV